VYLKWLEAAAGLEDGRAHRRGVKAERRTLRSAGGWTAVTRGRARLSGRPVFVRLRVTGAPACAANSRLEVVLRNGPWCGVNSSVRASSAGGSGRGAGNERRSMLMLPCRRASTSPAADGFAQSGSIRLARTTRHVLRERPFVGSLVRVLQPRLASRVKSSCGTGTVLGCARSAWCGDVRISERDAGAFGDGRAEEGADSGGIELAGARRQTRYGAELLWPPRHPCEKLELQDQCMSAFFAVNDTPRSVTIVDRETAGTSATDYCDRISRVGRQTYELPGPPGGDAPQGCVARRQRSAAAAGQQSS